MANDYVHHPFPQGGDYRPHYRKRETDAYISVLIGALNDVQDAIANLNGIEIPYDRSRSLSRCYNVNASLLAQYAARITGIVLNPKSDTGIQGKAQEK
jgi:hypothetical protein